MLLPRRLPHPCFLPQTWHPAVFLVTWHSLISTVTLFSKEVSIPFYRCECEAQSVLRDSTMQGAFLCFTSSLPPVSLPSLKARGDAKLQRQWAQEEASKEEKKRKLWHWLNGDFLPCFAVSKHLFRGSSWRSHSRQSESDGEECMNNPQGENTQSGQWWNHRKWTHMVHSITPKICTINGCKRNFPPHTSLQQRWQGRRNSFISFCLLQPSIPFLCNWVHLAKGLEPALPFQLLVQPSVLGSPYAVVWSTYGDYLYLQKAHRVRMSESPLIVAERWATWPHRWQGWGGAGRDERWKGGREDFLCLKKLGLHSNSGFCIPDPRVTCWPLLPAWLQPSCFSWRKEARLTSCTLLDSVSRQTASCQSKHNYRASCTGFRPPNTKEVNRIGAPETPKVAVPS